jgi:hypothetical protein
MRIFTGAPMPEGADTVFLQEDVQLDSAGNALLPQGLKAGVNVRPAGEDVAKGMAARPTGLRLRPQDVALIAAFGEFRDVCPCGAASGVCARRRGATENERDACTCCIQLQEKNCPA